MSTGPLHGIRVIELAGLGPGPFCAMMLADHGADVLRIDRPRKPNGVSGDPARDFLNRSRGSIAVDLKRPEGIALVRKLCGSADVVLEGYRPGVMERLGLGPDVLLAANPRLVYARMTGWGQDGPYRLKAGHDINYIAISGALHASGRAGEKPYAPLNLVGDFGGGAMMMAFGILAALLHVRAGGGGQVVDCSMAEGSALLMSSIYSMRALGAWRDERGVNTLDSGAHFYETYETADGRWIALGSIEPEFYRALLERLDLADDPAFADQHDGATWPERKRRFAEIFRMRTRDEWCDVFADADACFAPVMSLAEAPAHPQNKARGTFVSVGGATQPAPAPRYSATPPREPAPMTTGGAPLEGMLRAFGLTDDEVAALLS